MTQFAEQHAAVRLHYGCGHKQLAGYIGIDVRPTPVADYVLPAWDTSPWSQGSVQEIYSRHMLEHLDPADAARTLAAWFDVLEPGGHVRLIVPDLEFHARQLLGLTSRWGNDPNREVGHAMAGFYGWREPSRGGDREDAHRWGYTWAALHELLLATGFRDVVRVTTGPDSEPWHLHVIARKPAGGAES
jgi:hypothetical protein